MLLFALPTILLGLSGLGAAFCGMPDLTDEDHAIMRQLQANTSNRLDTRALSIDRIQVYVHVVTDSNLTDLYTDDVQKNIDVVNEKFADTAFSFELVDTRAIVYQYGTELTYKSDDEKAIKSHRIGTADTLNIYLVPRIARRVVGYSTFPWNYNANPLYDGIVIVRSGTPKSKPNKASLGLALVHEVGHWLGLLHTFQGGCTEPGDHVDDTPAENKGKGCPVSLDTCPGMPGLDPIHNYMSYHSEKCKSEFTRGQMRRMEDLWEKYRDAHRPRTTTKGSHSSTKPSPSSTKPSPSSTKSTHSTTKPTPSTTKSTTSTTKSTPSSTKAKQTKAG